jgi:alkylhydroperoxidase/carboxymuconolactone decarboxylase family protein YurZ
VYRKPNPERTNVCGLSCLACNQRRFEGLLIFSAAEQRHSDEGKMKRDLPSGAGRLADRHPKVWAAYEHLGEAVAEGGPLDAKTRRLVKLALAIGCSSEGAVHSHARRAVSEGVKPDELRHVMLLAIPTLGLPAAVKALTWIDDIIGDQ